MPVPSKDPVAGTRIVGSVQVETTLLLLKIGFLVLLYLFIWRIVSSAARDLRLPQESMIIGPAQAQAAGLVAAPAQSFGELVVVRSGSSSLEPGRRRTSP